MLSAGCHSRNNSRQTSSDSSSQTTPARRPRIDGAMTFRRLQIMKPSPPATARSNKISVQTGHCPSKTNVPLVNTVRGYLNRNSNIGVEDLAQAPFLERVSPVLRPEG